MLKSIWMLPSKDYFEDKGIERVAKLENMTKFELQNPFKFHVKKMIPHREISRPVVEDKLSKYSLMVEDDASWKTED